MKTGKDQSHENCDSAGVAGLPASRSLIPAKARPNNFTYLRISRSFSPQHVVKTKAQPTETE